MKLYFPSIPLPQVWEALFFSIEFISRIEYLFILSFFSLYCIYPIIAAPYYYK